jgi:hypothetical protein
VGAAQLALVLLGIAWLLMRCRRRTLAGIRASVTLEPFAAPAEPVAGLAPCGTLEVRTAIARNAGRRQRAVPGIAKATTNRFRDGINTSSAG